MILVFASRCATSNPQMWQVLGGKVVEVDKASQKAHISMLRISTIDGQNLQIFGRILIFFYESKIFQNFQNF